MRKRAKLTKGLNGLRNGVHLVKIRQLYSIMKKLLLALLMMASSFLSNAQTMTFHDFVEPTILGDSISMSQYVGKKLLIVNTASYCQYTPQFSDLRALDSTYAACNFEVIGFPCDDFGHQDPFGNTQILDFCQATYGVTFQMMSKVAIQSGDTVDVYKWLQRADLNGVSDAHVDWNFNKFLIDENGHWVAWYPSTVEPFDSQITNWITCENTTSVPSSLEQTQFAIKANPVKEQFILTGMSSLNDPATVRLTSIDGRTSEVLYRGNTQVGDMSFDVTNYASGIYMVQVQYDNNLKTMRLVIEK